jgi:hypothetical protein
MTTAHFFLRLAGSEDPPLFVSADRSEVQSVWRADGHERVSLRAECTLFFGSCLSTARHERSPCLDYASAPAIHKRWRPNE